MSESIGSFDKEAVRDGLKELAGKTVGDTMNALLESEADDLIKADRYGRAANRKAYRSGHYARRLTTTSGQVTSEMP